MESSGIINANSTVTLINGDLTINPTTSSRLLRLAGNTGNVNCTVKGNVYIQNGGLDLSSGTGVVTLNLEGDLVISGGTLSNSGGTSSSINFTKSGTSVFTKSGGTIVNLINWVVNSGTTLDFGTSSIDGGSGTFTLNSGGGIITANTAGITTSGATGSVQVTGTRTYSTSANYTFNGTAAQVTGNGFTGANNLTINNSAGVTLSANAAVSGTLTLTAGTLNLDTRTLTYSGTNITRTSGNINASNASAIMAFTNTSALTLPANLFTGNINTLTINGSGGVTLSSATTVASTLNLTNGVLTNGSHLTLSTGATINRNAGSLSAAPTFGTSVNVTYSNTASLNGGNELPTSTSVLNNLTTTGSSVVILTAPLQINGTLAISGSGNFNVSTYTLTFAGTSITKGGSGVLNVNTAGAGLTFVNTTALTLPANLFNASNIQNLTIDGGGGITLGSSISVSNTLTFINGKIILGANNLTLTNATVTGSSSSNYIVTNSTGSVIRSIASGNTFAFYIGRNTTNISPLSISNTGSSAVIYTVSVANTTYTTPADATNMQWSIAAGASTTSTLAFEWSTADAGANLSADPTNGKAIQYNGTTWDNRGGVTTGSPNITTVTGITDLTNPIWTVALEPVVLPTVTTNAATSITTTSVVLNGTINANGLSTTASFDYGTTISYGSNLVADQNPVNGSSPTAISKTLSSLSTNTLYNFRAKGVNTNGTVNGNNATFTTLSNAPTIGTGDNETGVGFRANWTAPTNDGTEAITYEIQVSTNNTNETNFVTNIVTTQSGVSATNFTFTTLNRVTTYYYRVRAVNAGGNSAWSAISAAITTLNATVASDAFRSFQSGNWNATSTWESFSAGSWIAATLTPNSSAAAINILNTHTVTVTANVTVDELIIEGGAQVIVNSGVTLTAANGTGNDIIVYGVLRNLGTLTLTGTMQVFSQGVYDHGVDGASIALPTVANIVWETGSTLKVSGTYSTATAANAGNLIGNETRAFANVLIDCNFTNTDAYLSLSAGTLTIDTLRIVATGNGEVLASVNFATVCGTYIQTGGLFYCGRNNGTNRNLTVNGNVTISGGALHIKNQGSSAAGQLFVGGNLTVESGGTLTNSGTAGTARLNFTGSSPQIWSNQGTFSATGSIGFVIEVTGTGGVTLNDNITLPIGGSFTLTSGNFKVSANKNLTVNGTTTISIASGTTLTVDGTLTHNATGSITTNGTLSISNGGKYIHNRGSATLVTAAWNTGSTCEIQNIGGGTTFAFGGQTLHHLIWNNSNQAGSVQLSASLGGVNGNLEIQNCANNNGRYFRLTSSSGYTLNIGGNLFISAANGAAGLDFGNSSGTNCTINVTGNVEISNGGSIVTSATGALLRVAGNFINNGTFTSTNTTVEFNGSTVQSINGTTTFNNLTVHKSSGTLTVNNDISIASAGSLNLTQGTLDDGGNTISVAGNITGTSSGQHIGDGKILMNNTSGRTFGGDVNIKNIQFEGTSNVTMVASSGHTTTIYGDAIFNGPGAFAVNPGNTLVFGDTANIYRNYGAGNIINLGTPAGNVFYGTTAGGLVDLFINASCSNSGEYLPTQTPGIINSVNIANGVTYTLLASRATKTLNLNNTGILALDPTSTLTYTINGEITGNGTISGKNTASINFAGAYDNTLRMTTGFEELNNLTVNVSSNTVTLNQPLTVHGNLALTSGTLNTNGNTVTLFGNVSGTGTQLSLGKILASGTAKTIAGATFDHLEIASGSSYSLNGNPYIKTWLVLNDNLEVTAGRTLNTDGLSIITANTHQLTGTGTVNINATFRTSNTNGFSGTNATIPNATVNFGTNATVEYNATVAQVFSARTDYRNVTLNGNSIKTLNGNATILGTLTLIDATDRLAIASNTLTLEGTFTGNGVLRGSTAANLTLNGTGDLGQLQFDQTTDGTTNVLNTFTINRASSYPTFSATLGNKLVITNVYNPLDGLIHTNNNLHLRSTASNTARIAAGNGLGGYIYGDVTVERYISALGNRAYRLLTPGVTTITTIRDNWQEGVSNTQQNLNIPSPTPGYGTHITGSINPNSLTAANAIAGGFDVTQNNQYSLYYFNQNTQNWEPATNTNSDNLDAKKGYLLFVRGNRDNINTINTTTGNSNTILRARGTLLQGHQSFTNLASNGDLSLVTNPFASPINWSTIYAGSNATNFENYITIWDPNIGTRGGFVTVNNINDVSNNASNLTINIQSGQAFFIKTKPAVNTPSFVIFETDKSTTNNLDVFRTGTQTERLKIQLRYTASGIDRNADGVLVKFANAFSNAVDENDAIQIANWDEDIAMVRAGKDLSIESRNLISDKDTIFLKIANLRSAQGTYRWVIQPEQFNAPGLEAFLEDNFTNTSTPISLTANTTINFTVTTNTSSTAANRFRIVFRTMAALPVNFITVAAVNKENKNYISWQVGEEVNIKHYVIERSADGRSFTNLSSIAANNLNTYAFVDDKPIIGATNFYRIVAVGLEGRLTFSNVVKVNTHTTKQPTVEVYPNPVVNNVMQLSFSNMLADNYTITLYNANGQKIYQSAITINGSVNKVIPLSPAWASGIYKLVVVGLVNKQTYSTTVVKE